MYPCEKCYIIAEAGVNHNGSAVLAHRLVDAAREAGADAVKFQTFRSDKLASHFARKVAYQVEQTGSGESQQEMLRKLELGEEDFLALKAHCDSGGIEFLSTPFDVESADFLEPLVGAYKISSGDVTNLPFLEHLARKGKAVILSTGMSTLAEVAEAVEAIIRLNNQTLTLLHCTTNYPTPPGEVNLRAMLTLRNAFHTPVGYSDHTRGIEIPLAAVALGAVVIEKHFTLDRTLPGPDHSASLEPPELLRLVQGIRNVEAAMGDGIKQPTESEKALMDQVRKGIVAARDLEAGTVLQSADIATKRPAAGLAPRLAPVIIGRTLARSAARDEPLTWEHFLQ